MLADCLTKVIPGGYARKIGTINARTKTSEKVAANKEVDELNAKMAKHVKQELYDDTGKDDEEIS
eukprot:1614681-Pyramimonas_sp.AAC.1